MSIKTLSGSIYDDLSGVFLDADYERMVSVDLPWIKSTKKTFDAQGNTIDERESQYGEVMFIGDFHLGHSAHSGNPLNAHLLFIKERPHIRVGLMGDLIEYAATTPYPADEIMNVDQQIDLLVKKLKPIKDQIVFMLWGNHEERHARNTKSNKFLDYLALEIEVPESCYVGKPQRGVYVSFKAGDKIYSVYAHHSRTNARINRMNQLQRAGSQNIFSIIAQGHTHELAWIPRTFRQIEIVDGRTMNVVRRQYLLATGCFMKDPAYAEAGGYPYTVVGAPVVRFYADRNKLDEYDLSMDYKDYLNRGGVPFSADTGITDWKGLGAEKRVIEKCLL